MRKKLVAGNWKMNKTIGEAVELVGAVKDATANVDDVDILVCPTFTALQAVAAQVKDSNIALGAQNMYWEEKGAFTGEISPVMLKDVGCRYVILGHSERRGHFGETDETVNLKCKKALKEQLTPIVCVGEKLEQREAKQTDAVVTTQIEQSLAGLGEQLADVVVAYEPVWAIGTGKTATPEQAQEVHVLIRALVRKLANDAIGDGIRILYGGSVKPDNAEDLFSQADIDGGLIGGAALQAEPFLKIIEAARKG